MKEHPQIFDGPSVRSLLAGTRTQARRILKVQPPGEGYQLAYVVNSTDRRQEDRHHWVKVAADGYTITASDDRYFKIPYQVDDRIWVRETWCDYNAGYSEAWRAQHPEYQEPHYIYRADFNGTLSGKERIWKASIHMPRRASRILLEITSVRVERLQDITEADAIAEGTKDPSLRPIVGACWSERHVFAKYWDHHFGDGAWDTNPWVVVLEFKRITPA